jgi:hypothetical protein
MRVKSYHVFVIVVGLIFMSCSFYHMQTPKTVASGKVVGGFGLGGAIIDDNPAALPGAWVRTGLGPHTDIGFHTWGLGMKTDIKHSLADYFAIGAGGALAFMGGIAYNGEASLYTGIPGRILNPYAIGRLNFFGFSAEGDELDFDLEPGISTVGGIRINIGRMLATYIEGGILMQVFDEGNDLIPIFGLGVSIGPTDPR